MRSGKGLRQGYKLPEVLQPENTVCIRFQIPDAPEYRQAVVSKIWDLGKWYTWEKTIVGDTRATEAAQIIRDILQATLEITENCGDTVMFQLRQNSEDTCLLEQSLDGGNTWTTAFDYKLCAGGAPPLVRFTPEGDMEISLDGGNTWEDAGNYDPRNTAAELPPLNMADGDAKRCQLATNIYSMFKTQVDQMINDAQAWGSVAGLVAILVGILITIGIIGSGGALTPLLLTIAAGLLGTGSAAFAAAFTAQVWEDFTCIIYCNTEPDGTITEAGMVAIKTEIDFQIGGIAGDHLNNLITLTGLIGLNNAGRTMGQDTPDCAPCECNVCSTWTESLIYWDTPTWTEGIPARWSAQTPPDEFDTIQSVGGRYEFLLPAGRYIRRIGILQAGSSSGVWLTYRIRIDGVSIGVFNSTQALQFINFTDNQPRGQRITFEGVTWNVSNQHYMRRLELLLCDE